MDCYIIHHGQVPVYSMEILTAVAILPFLAALVVGAREAEEKEP